MPGRLDGQVALVTGAGSGIGRATAIAFASEGARVVVSDIDDAGGAATVDTIHAAGGDARYVHADVSRDADAAALVQAAVDTFGGLDCAFNNAGIEGVLAATADQTPEQWRHVLDVNLTGVWQCMRHEIPRMLERGGGAIVNNASILGLVGFANAPAYSASKHGMLGLTKSAALEYATRGIRVNAVCPGFIETPMVMERGVGASRDRAMYERLAKLHPMNRLGKPEEIADVVVWLCSRESSFVTGQGIAVDGGYTIE